LSAAKPVACARDVVPARRKNVAAVGSFSMTCLTAAAFQIDPPAANPIQLAE
jgi:hypothetical protein